MKQSFIFLVVSLILVPAFAQSAATPAAPSDVQSTVPPDAQPVAAPAAPPDPGSTPANPSKPNDPGVQPTYSGAIKKTPSGNSVVVNYWQLVRDIMMRIKSAPPRGRSVSAGLDTLNQEYPFDAFRNLRVLDLTRAAHEGVRVARRTAAKSTPEEVNRQVRTNVALCYEYLPLLVRDPADAKILAQSIGNSESDLEERKFLLEKLMPDQPAPSLLSKYLDDVYYQFGTEFQSALDQVAGHPSEKPELQMLAIQVVFRRLCNEYENIFHHDPKVAEMEKNTGQPIPISAMKSATPPPIDNATRDALSAAASSFERFAGVIASHIDPFSARNQMVKDETRRVLQYMVDNILLPHPDKVRVMLDPTLAVKEPAPFEIPKNIPAMPLPGGNNAGGAQPGFVPMGPDGMPLI